MSRCADWPRSRSKALAVSHEIERCHIWSVRQRFEQKDSRKRVEVAKLLGR